MKIALAQINTTVGDFQGNADRILAAYQRATEAGADLMVCPELTISGYPPRDLLQKRSFVRGNQETLGNLAARTGEVGLLVGYVGESGVDPGRELRNSAALLHRGRVETVRHKTLLPTYDVFDEDRYFEPADINEPVDFGGERVGITVCEDLWNDEDFWRHRRYRRNPALDLSAKGASVIVNLSASPWHLGKNALRHSMLSGLAAKCHVPLMYCNLVGGNDELIFDGGSLAFGGHGELLGAARLFEEDLLMVDTGGTSRSALGVSCDEEKIYKALVLGLRDYLGKCGFKTALLGLSGGIDSALVACLAADALGARNVRGISLPSEFSSKGSLDDARELALNLGIQYDSIPIQESFLSVKSALRPLFGGRPEDTTEENLQARLRGVMLMGLSNKFGAMLLTTGNKSEMAVGYCTLYGDMCGGLAVISDVPKTMVYRISRWVNRDREVIPWSSIRKPPSAELRPNQTDQDSLPPYDVLDAILEAYVVEGLSPGRIVARGYEPGIVDRVVRLIDQSEYKRRQAAPGLRVTTKAFGVGRRIPIAHRFKG